MRARRAIWGELDKLRNATDYASLRTRRTRSGARITAERSDLSATCLASVSIRLRISRAVKEVRSFAEMVISPNACARNATWEQSQKKTYQGIHAGLRLRPSPRVSDTI